MKKPIYQFVIMFSIIGVSLGQGPAIMNFSVDTKKTEFSYFSQDSLSTIPDNEKIPIVGFMYSFVLPGAGQKYGNASWARAGLFASIDLIGILAHFDFKRKAEDIRLKYENYADQNWFLDTWIWNTQISKIPGWDAYPDLHLAGSHSLYLKLYGDAKVEFGEYVSSDKLGEIISAFPGVGEDQVYTNSLMTVVRDRDFYENIGKYDQFVGGWTDARSAWYADDKVVESSTETIIMTPRKKYYIKERDKNNQMLNYGRFAISAVMFNHIVSALDAVFVVNRHNSEQKIDLSYSLLYSQENSLGIGGVQVSFSF